MPDKPEKKKTTKLESIVGAAFLAILVWIGIETGWLRDSITDTAFGIADYWAGDGGKFWASIVFGFAVLFIGCKINPKREGAVLLWVISGVTLAAWLIGWLEASMSMFMILSVVATFVALYWCGTLKERWIEEGRQQERDKLDRGRGR